LGLGGSTVATSYYTLAFGLEVDAFKIVPYKQIFFFTRPWDIMEPAGTGPVMGEDDNEGSGSGDDSWGSSSTGDDGEDDGEDDGSEDFYGRLLRLEQSDSSYDSYDDSSYGSYDDSWDLGSLSGSLGSTGSENAADEAQGFHMFVGGAYDFEVGKVFVSYCEGAYTSTNSIWALGGNYWATTYAPNAAPTLM